jgi:NTP pyrophosphatase (non-canonical NTP hydrolase)
MTYQELLDAAVRVREKYNQLNARDNGAAWDGDKLMAGFVGDVGDLSKIVMAKNGYRAMDDVDAKLRHELADCLWSVLVLAKYYDIDLETQFITSMKELEVRVDGQLAA